MCAATHFCYMLHTMNLCSINRTILLLFASQYAILHSEDFMFCCGCCLFVFKPVVMYPQNRGRISNIGTLTLYHSLCDSIKSKIIYRLKIISLLSQMEKFPDSSLLNELLKDQKAVEEIKKIRIIC